jgi:hypothetical protein
MHLSVFEAGMLLCFGISWPISIYKSLKSRSTKGKSLLFLIILEIGYVSGILHKILYSRDIIMILYILNLTMVAVDICLFFRNKRYEAAAEATVTPAA